jgi:hypothetical protein
MTASRAAGGADGETALSVRARERDSRADATLGAPPRRLDSAVQPF